MTFNWNYPTTIWSGENRINETYTGDSDLNPFDESNWNGDDGGDPEVAKKKSIPAINIHNIVIL